MIDALVLTALFALPREANATFAVMDECFIVETRDSLGTGFLVSPTLVATASHVVGGARSVHLRSGATKAGNAVGTVVLDDRQDDIALVQLDAPWPGSPLPVKSELPAIGEEVYTVGGPIDGLVASRGVVVTASAAGIESTAPVDHGNSGGPMVNSAGEVVGIVTQMVEGKGDVSAPTYSYAVPAQFIDKALSDYEATDTPSSSVPIPSPTSTGVLAVYVLITAILAAACIAVFVVLPRRKRTKNPRIVITLD